MSYNKIILLAGPSGPISRLKISKNAQKSVFPFKNDAKGTRFGLKPILIDAISGYYISNYFSMNSNKFTPLTGPLWTYILGPKPPKNLYFPSKMVAQGQ